MILLAVGYFTEQRPFGFSNFKSILKLECGLNVYAPKDNAEVTFPYKLYGYAKGCDWEPIEGMLGTVTILNSMGVVGGTFDLPVSNESDGSPYYFETTLTVPASFWSEEGTIVIENLLPGLQHTYKTIPVHFNSNL